VKRPAVTVDTAIGQGLTPEEYESIVKRLGRTPTFEEVAVFGVMWSEHCSYKSSRHWLRQLPTTGPQVLQGPGENAGAVDVGDGLAAVFKIESHNHPSFVEPFQGAATGVGGILRDVFTMGARPIAIMDSLRFGSLDHPRTPYLTRGVVAGIGHYGNCIGVANVGGDAAFDSAYDHNILVNAFTLGIAPADRLFRAKAAGPGNPVIYVGSRTGRDGTAAIPALGDSAAASNATVTGPAPAWAPGPAVASTWAAAGEAPASTSPSARATATSRRTGTAGEEFTGCLVVGGPRLVPGPP
jgi:phosphoribosylformylglycinamidine synthase